MKTKLMDIKQPKDNYDKRYAHMEYLRGAIFSVDAKKIKVRKIIEVTYVS